LLLLGVLLLLLLYVFQNWLAAFLICYVTILVLLGLIGLVRLVQGVLRKSCQKFAGASKGTGSEGHLPSKPVYVPPHIYKRPDPMIYSQQYLMSKGIGVTWDNPDIQLYDGNTPVSSHQLEIKHTYRIRAEIWNGSWDAPVVNMLVRFHYLSFGIGTVKNYIGQTFVDVPVKGAAGLPSVADCDWTTPEAAGHYCIQVELVWADDANPFNNLGQENTDVKKLNSPNATFQFTLRNDSALPRKLELRADTYTLPPKEPCAERTRDEQWRSERDPFDRHRLGLYPLPEGWRLNLEPGDTLEMRPGEERIITLNVTARDDFVGQQAININAFDGRDLVGGVTLFVHS
jgi:hypothetical protein